MDATPEQWLPVVGFEGRYEVSDQGRVRSLDRIVEYIDGRSGKTCLRHSKGRILRPGTAVSGHQYVVLENRVTRTVHSLVAEAFIGPRPEGEEVRHFPNRNPADNRAANLSYGSRSKQADDSKQHGTHFHAGLTRCKRGHDLTDPNNLQKVAKGDRRACLACRRQLAAQRKKGQSVTTEGFCINGHPMTPENRYTNGSRSTRCKPCALERRKTA